MHRLKRLALAFLAITAIATAGALEALAQSGKPVTYLALVWVKPDGQASLAEYEKRFGAILKKWNASAKPNAILLPQRINSTQRGGFAYPLPSRIDIVTFPSAETLPRIMSSPEWLAIKPLRDAALADFVMFETTNLLDPNQKK